MQWVGIDWTETIQILEQIWENQELSYDSLKGMLRMTYHMPREGKAADQKTTNDFLSMYDTEITDCATI